MRITRTLAVGLAAAGLALAGCGGGNSDEDQIRDAINNVADDPAKICDYLGNDVEEQIGGVDKCKELAEGDDLSAEGGDVEIKSVEVDGDKAVATVSTKEDGDEDVNFVKEDGDWVFSDLG